MVGDTVVVGTADEDAVVGAGATVVGPSVGGAVRNGVTYMPPFGEIFSDEAIWAIRSWLDTVAEE